LGWCSDCNGNYNYHKKEVEVSCTWEVNDPKPGLKSLYRDDTKEKIETYEMTLLDTDEKADADFVPGKKK
jgi:hypothetical protein